MIHHEDVELAAMKRDYVISLTEVLHDLDEAWSDRNLEVIADLAHQTRGVAAMFGFPTLTDSAARLEDAIRDQTAIEWIGVHVLRFRDVLDQINIRGTDRPLRGGDAYSR
jgi:HPt (histidine-containing phosphotransfer) domain-containing protein